MWAPNCAALDTEDILEQLGLSIKEFFVYGAQVVFFNEYGMKQDRILVLTSRAYYRIKFDFTKNKIEHYQQILLKDVTHIQKGAINDSNWGPKACGFRIWHREFDNEKKSYTNNLSHRIFKIEGDTNQGQYASQFCKLMCQARNTEAPQSPINVEEVDEIVYSDFALWSGIHNTLGLGRQKRASTLFGSTDKEKLVSSLNPSNNNNNNNSNSTPSGTTPVTFQGTHKRSNSAIDQEDNEHPLRKTSVSVDEEQLARNLLAAQQPTGPYSTLGSAIYRSTSEISSQAKNVTPTVPRSRLQEAKQVVSILSTPLAQHIDSNEGLQSETAVAEEEHILRPDEQAAPKPVTIDQIRQISHQFEKLNSVGPFTFLITSAFFVGYFDFSVLWIIGAVILLKWMDQSRIRRIYNRKRVEYRSLLKTSAARPVAKTEKSSCAWVSQLFAVLFPHISQMLNAKIKEKLIQILENTMNQKKPAAVEALSVTDVQFGSISPEFLSIVGEEKNPFPDNTLEVDVKYTGPLKIILEVTLGGKFLNLRVPIAVQDFDIKGRVRFDFVFFHLFPYLHHISWSFIEEPSIEVAIKPIYAIDLMDIPLVNEWIVESIRNSVRNTAVLPRQLKLPIHYSAGPLQGSLMPLRPEIEEIYKKRYQSPYDGIVRVKIVAASRLLQDGACPYCIVSLPSNGAYAVTPQVAKSTRNPVFNHYLELLTPKTKPTNSEKVGKHVLELIMMGRETVREEYMGRGVLVIETGEGRWAKDAKVDLECEVKGGGGYREKVRAGQVHVVVEWSGFEDVLRNH